MLTNPHDTCAQIINTLRTSGLTYTLNETPYSVYLTLRKKFLKEYIPQTLNQATNKQNDPKIDKTSEYENTISKLREALNNEIADHNATKNELSHTESEAEKLVEYINKINSKEEHSTSMIHTLQIELAEEADGHSKSEHALQQLEGKMENLQLELQEKVNHVARVIEEKEALTDKLEDAEQAMRELENTVKEKNSVVSLLKDQIKLSKNEILKLHQTQSISAPPGTPLSSLSQTCTPPGISHIGTDLRTTHEGSNNNLSSDKHCNMSPKNSSSRSSSSDSLATPSRISPPGTMISGTQSSIKSPHYRRNCEKYCQNCKNEVSEDLDIEIPSPIYFYDFLSECPSPWLHYGYCRPCLEVARSSGSQITQHIAQCPAFIDQCWDGEHETLITHYENTESENLKSVSENLSSFELLSTRTYVLIPIILESSLSKEAHLSPHFTFSSTSFGKNGD